MNANDVLVGNLVTRQKLDADGDPRFVPHRDLRLRAKGQVEPVLRAFGQRTMHVDMLGRVQQYLDRTGEQLAAHCVLSWLTPDHFDRPPAEDMAAAVVRLREREARLKSQVAWQASRQRRQQLLKEAAYCEAAAFCVEAWTAALG